MRKFLGIFASVSWLALSFAPCEAYAQATSVVVTTCGTQTYATTASSGSRQYPTQDTTGAACSSGGGSGSNASVGTNGATAPASSTQSGGKTAAGNLVANCVDTNGVLCAPQAGTSNRTRTATTMNGTSITICPAATNPVVTEIFFTTASVGIGLGGQALTTATPGGAGTESTTPDIFVNTANTLYTFPVGPSNAITGFGASGVVRCIQTLRQ